MPGDVDRDGLPDDFELANDLNPDDPSDAGQDPDGDGLTNLEEFSLGTDPFAADTDGDRLGDSAEITQGTNPTDPDSDLDGLIDGDEITLGSDPLNADSDGDGFSDDVEVTLTGSPFDADPLGDVDGDGVSNLDEIEGITDPTDPDTDGDGLTDGEEIGTGTDPIVVDSEPPVVEVTSPVDGETVTEGDEISISAKATDDGRVVRLDLLVDGSVVESRGVADARVSFTVPIGVDSITFGAVAVDTNGNTGSASAVSVLVKLSELTTVVGAVVDEGGSGLGGISVQALGLPSRDDVQILGLGSTTRPDGTFTIQDISTLAGRIVIVAVGKINGQFVLGRSSGRQPERGTATDVGDIEMAVHKPVEIEYGQDIEASIDNRGEMDVFSFEAQAGDVVLIRSKNLVEVFNAEGALLAIGQGSLIGQDSVNIRVEMSGTFFVVVRDRFTFGSGTYVVDLVRLNDPERTVPLRFGKMITASLDTPEKRDYYSFEAQAGDVVRIRMTELASALTPRVEVFNSEGTHLGSRRDDSQATVDVQVESSGTFFVLIRGFDTGEYAGETTPAERSGWSGAGESWRYSHRLGGFARGDGCIQL